MANSAVVMLFILFAVPGLAKDICSPKGQSLSDTARAITSHLHSTQKMGIECVEQEFVDVVLDPFRLQDVALNLCAEESKCLDFLKREAVRVSLLPAARFEKMSARELWSEITRYSGLNRIRPPMLPDLPLMKSPAEVFGKLKQAQLSERELTKSETLSFACAALALIAGPGKVKILTATKQVSKVYKIQHSKEVTKLIEKNRLPQNVKEKVLKWASEVEQKGLEEVRKTAGYHDEVIRSLPNRRSVRVSDGFRVCYESLIEKGVTILKIITISNDHRDSSYCR